MASLEVHGVIGPTTLRRLCAEQTMANHCKTQFTEQGSDQPYRSLYLHRHSCAGLGVLLWERRDILAIPLKSGCSGATVDGRSGKPCYHAYPTHSSNLSIRNVQMVKVFSIKGMQRYLAFLCIYCMCFR